MAQLKITLIRSAAHRLPKQRKIVKALGLNRVNSSVVKPDNEATRGALFQIAHLIDVEQVKD
ncbi:MULTISPECIES: 50S ribosomal protein L30 [Lentilactobacillus]|uniref:Large ribosomal subunit protein uL30 n=2 Tax=Lentilactobacillus TaxID=2767893 RepID=A0A1S6QJ33_9LACO|nr:MULTISPECIES: 50S ribosomal protein L30 [Lentilactobacillus]AQW21615.1 50S ribosomal protein L30 [Lentilactobacillus curieae]GAY73258.1 LSU ribosomal protein L30p [Lentilactobacillus kosonis]